MSQIDEFVSVFGLQVDTQSIEPNTPRAHPCQQATSENTSFLEAVPLNWSFLGNYGNRPSQIYYKIDESCALNQKFPAQIRAPAGRSRNSSWKLFLYNDSFLGNIICRSSVCALNQKVAVQIRASRPRKLRLKTTNSSAQEYDDEETPAPEIACT